jgi:hypothetical protein
MNARRAKRRLLLLLALVLAGAGYAVYVGVGLKARIGATRTAVPGRRALRLAAGKYDVYFELPGDYDQHNQFTEPSDLAVSIAPFGGRPLPLAPYGGASYVGSSTSKALAIDEVTIPHSGLYRLATRWPGGRAYHSTVVLGAPPGSAYIRLAISGVIAVLAFIALCILGPGTIALLRQGTQLDAPSIGVQPDPDQLRKLTELRDRGALTDDEFEAERNRLLGTPA